MRKRNNSTPNLDRQKPAQIPGWNQVALCALALSLSALPFHAQQKTRPEFGPGGGPNCGNSGACAPPIADVPPLIKPVVIDDEKFRRRREASMKRDVMPLTRRRLKKPSGTCAGQLTSLRTILRHG
jgi:hypothetical protein